MASGGKVRARLRSDESQDALPYSVMVRRERSRELAQKRRTTYKTIMDDLTQVRVIIVEKINWISSKGLSLSVLNTSHMLLPLGIGAENITTSVVILIVHLWTMRLVHISQFCTRTQSLHLRGTTSTPKYVY